MPSKVSFGFCRRQGIEYATGPDQDAFKLNRDTRLAKARTVQADVQQRLLDFAMQDGKVDGEGYMKAKERILAEFKPHYAALRVQHQKGLQQDFARISGAVKNLQREVLTTEELKKRNALLLKALPFLYADRWGDTEAAIKKARV